MDKDLLDSIITKPVTELYISLYADVFPNYLRIGFKSCGFSVFKLLLH